MRNITNETFIRTKTFRSGKSDWQHPTICGMGNENKFKYEYQIITTTTNIPKRNNYSQTINHIGN